MLFFLTEHVGGVLESVHELVLVEASLHLEGLDLDLVEGLLQELLLVIQWTRHRLEYIY